MLTCQLVGDHLSDGDAQGVLIGHEGDAHLPPALLPDAVIGHLPAGFLEKLPGRFQVVRAGLQLWVIGPGARDYRGVGADRPTAQ